MSLSTCFISVTFTNVNSPKDVEKDAQTAWKALGGEGHIKGVEGKEPEFDANAHTYTFGASMYSYEAAVEKLQTAFAQANYQVEGDTWEAAFAPKSKAIPIIIHREIK